MKLHLSLGQICATNYLSNLNLWVPDVAKHEQDRDKLEHAVVSLHINIVEALIIFSLTLLQKLLNVILERAAPVGN